MLTLQDICCPYCGKTQQVTVDCSVEVQDYYEDCQVCCRPMSMHVLCSWDGDLQDLIVRSENDT